MKRFILPRSQLSNISPDSPVSFTTFPFDLSLSQSALLFPLASSHTPVIPSPSPISFGYVFRFDYPLANDTYSLSQWFCSAMSSHPGEGRKSRLLCRGGTITGEFDGVLP